MTSLGRRDLLRDAQDVCPHRTRAVDCGSGTAVTFAAERGKVMSAVSIKRPHVHKGTLGLALLSLCFVLSASPAFALDRALTSYGALCNGSADDTPELRAAFKDAGSRWTNLIFPSSGV